MATTNYNLPTITGNMTADVVRDVNALAEAADTAIKGAVDSVDLSEIEQSISKVEARITAHDNDSVRHTTASDKAKLAGIEAGAQVNAVTSVSGKTGAVSLTKADVGMSNVDNVKQASKAEFDALSGSVTAHLEEIMPHLYVDNGVKYRWGFRTVNGEGQFIYEEVV